MQSWDQFPAAAPHQQGPLIPRTPPPQTPTNEAIDRERLRSLELANANTEANNAQGLTPEAIHLQAQQYILTGQLPALGMGRQAASARQSIINEAARMAGVAGRSGADMATGFARFRNSQHTLQTLDQQLGTIRGNEATALANAQQFLDRIHELYPPGSTRLGNMIRHGINEFLNDPTQAAYNSAYTTFLTEYAKVVAGSPSGSGVLSDSARREQMDALSNATSPEGAEAAVQQMRADMQNRIQALQGNILHGYENLSSGRPASFAPNGDMLDDHGAVVPTARNSGPAGGSPPILGAPPSGPSGGSPPDRLDRTSLTSGTPREDMSISDTGTTNQDIAPDFVAAGVNRHVASMIANPDITNAQIRRYVRDAGAHIANLGEVLTFRNTPGFGVWQRQHPGEAYPMLPPRIERPLTWNESLNQNFADSGPGTAAITTGNMVTGQNLPEIIGATGGNEERARAGIEELRSRHPIGATVGDIAGGAMLYNAGTRVVEGGIAAAERVAPSVVARLPAWVRGAAAAGEEGAAVNPYSAAAATDATLAPTATFAPRAIAGDAAIGAYESPGNRLEGAEIGVATGMAGRGAMNTAGRAVSPTGGDLAPAYEEGVQPTVGQRMGGAANRVEQAFQSIPVVGGVQRSARSRALDQWQLGGFNRALRNLPDEVQLPAKMEPGTAPHAFAQDAFDTAYDRVHSRINVVDDAQLQQDLAGIRQTAETLSEPSMAHFNRILESSVLRRLRNQREAPASEASNSSEIARPTTAEEAWQLPSGTRYIGPDGVTRVRTSTTLTGEELQKALSEIRRTARSLRSSPTGDRELADTLDDLSAAIHGNAARHSAPEAIETLGGINRGYGMLVRIENAANRPGAGEPGEYTAKALLNADRQQGGLRGRQFLAGNGLMSDYANAGLRLGQTVADSGTAERLATMTGGTGLAGGIGAAAHSGGMAGTIPAAAWALDTFANLPGVRNAINWTLRPNRPSIRPITDEIRAQIQARAGAVSALGLPAVVAAYGTREAP